MVFQPFSRFSNSYTQDSEEDETEEPDFIPPPPPMTVWCLVPSDLQFDLWFESQPWEDMQPEISGS